tara:strand:- start:229 stop:510 length:282 start_codon:yes stop_codon:yes gene_type:complete
MITGNMLAMFIIGFIIFCFYLFGLLYAIYWGHNSQKKDMENDPELKSYYARHGQGDLMDYDGMGNQGRFVVDVNDKRKKKNDKRRYRTKTRQK